MVKLPRICPQILKSPAAIPFQPLAIQLQLSHLTQGEVNCRGLLQNLQTKPPVWTPQQRPPPPLNWKPRLHFRTWSN